MTKIVISFQHKCFLLNFTKELLVELYCILVASSTRNLVGGHGVADPGLVVAHLSVDTGLIPHGTAIAPGHNTLQHSIADHGATGVTLDKNI